MSRRTRGRRSLARRPPHLPERKCVLIVTEGLKTEPSYFKALKKALNLPGVRVEIVGQGGHPRAVVEKAVNRKEEWKDRQGFEFDQVWCVVDVEQPGDNPSLTAVLHTADKAGIDVALSNPCFEFWYLLHFDRRAGSFENARAVVTALKGYLPAYTKGNRKIAEDLIPLREEAIAHAKSVEEHHEHAGTARTDRNPNTEVYKLVEYLQRIVEQGPY